MVQNVVILSENRKSSTGITYSKLGKVVGTLSQLYQMAKEQRLELILVDENRHDLTAAVAARIRRRNGLTDIWQLVETEESAVPSNTLFDGRIGIGGGYDAVSKKIAQILKEKELLERYGMVGRSPAMRALVRTIYRISPTDVSVLIVGPSGSGKELVARALHTDSLRADKPFVTINCGALAEGLLESELFGHEKGAFTGSVSKREGLFHKAEGGTLFLDEIGETNPNMQVKLLRVLEDGSYYPVGSSVPRRANVRVVAATNRDLIEAIADKSFREDLYFRVGVVKIILPPLMDRRMDILPLLQHFWQASGKLDYTDSALEKLTNYDWPGNVRQLRNFTSRMAALKPEGMVDNDDIDRFLTEQHAQSDHLPVSTGRTVEESGQELIYRAILSMGNEIRMLRDIITANLPGESEIRVTDISSVGDEAGSTMDEMEKALILQMLKETGGNRKTTAQKLGIGERTLYRKLTKYDLK